MADFHSVISKLHKSLVVAVGGGGICGFLYVAVVTHHDSYVAYRAFEKYNDVAERYWSKDYKGLPLPKVSSSEETSTSLEMIRNILSLDAPQAQGDFPEKETRIRDAGIDCRFVVGAETGYSKFYYCKIVSLWADSFYSDYWNGMKFSFVWLLGTTVIVGVLQGLKFWVRWLAK